MDEGSDTSGLGARDGLPPMPPGPPHDEKHLGQSRFAREFADGLAAGVLAPLLVLLIMAALGAEQAKMLLGIAAASLGVAVHGALAAGFETLSRNEHWQRQRAQEEYETEEWPERERWEVMAILHRYGVRGDALRLAVEALCSSKARWVDFMMRFELNLPDPEPIRAAAIAGGIAGRLLAGAMLALPWMLAGGATALLLSVLVGFALFGAGSGLRAATRGMAWPQAAIRGGIAGGAAVLAAGLVLLAAG